MAWHGPISSVQEDLKGKVKLGHAKDADKLSPGGGDENRPRSGEDTVQHSEYECITIVCAIV